MAITQPPGQERPYPPPTSTGKVPFQVGGTDRQCETYYLLWGDLSNSSKIPIIILHGGPGSTHGLDMPFSLLHVDLGIPVILYDQIGCGSSTHLPEKLGDTSFWNAELFMDELENLISTLGIGTFDLYGGSWGGMLASVFAIRRQPRGLRKLLLSSCPARSATRVAETNRLLVELPAPHGENMRKAFRDKVFDTEAVRLAWAEYSKRYFLRIDPPPPELEETRKISRADRTVYHTMYGPESVNQTGPMKDWNVEEELKLITAETAPGGVLVMNGAHEAANYRVMSPFFLNIRARVRWITFAESAHIHILEETEKVLAVTEDFLQAE